MSVKIEWLGHDSFRLTGAGKVVYIDPYRLRKHEPVGDVILISHDHDDHLSIEDVKKLSGPNSVIGGPESVARQIPGCMLVAQSDQRVLSGVPVTTVPAYNMNKFEEPGHPFHPKGEGVGYIVELEGERIYHIGDSDYIPEMRDLAPDVVLIPVSGVYVMSPEEAAAAVRLIRPKRAIPMHYGTIVGSERDARLFARLSGVPVEILSRVM